MQIEKKKEREINAITLISTGTMGRLSCSDSIWADKIVEGFIIYLLLSKTCN